MESPETNNKIFTSFLCKEIIVAKSKEVKTGYAAGCGSSDDDDRNVQ
jgi:hypothetical protein